MLSSNPRAFITYDGLPISSGGAHTIRARDHRLVWDKASSFLHSYASRETPDEIFLVLYEGSRVEPRFFTEARKRIEPFYGHPHRRVAVSGVVQEHENRWPLEASDIAAAIELMASLEPFPQHWLGGPLFLGIRSRFRLLDPDTLLPLPYQEADRYGSQDEGVGLPLGSSVFHLRLAHPSTCGLFLSFPFETTTPEAIAYIRRLEQGLPFRLSEKHWSRWQMNAEATRYYKRKISLPDVPAASGKQ